MAAELERRYPDATIQLIPSKGGRFEVVRDGTPIFQKSVLQRHAKPGEILSLLSASKTS